LNSNDRKIRGGGTLTKTFSDSISVQSVFFNMRGYLMKRVLISALALLFVASMAAFAGEYHMDGTLSCYQCHTMHYSQSHGYGYSHDVDFLVAGGPYDYLLRGPVNELCLECHDNDEVIDVYQASDVYEATNREAGFLNKVGDANTNCGHTLGTTDAAPGSNPTWMPPNTAEGLTCVDCHHQHGSKGSGNPDQVKGQWRNLVYRPGNVATGGRYVTYDKPSETGYPNSTTRDIQVRVNSPFVEGQSYETDYIDFYEPVANESRYGAWCQGCHTDFHGNSTSENMHGSLGWLRHPTADANIGAVGGGNSSRTDFASHAYRPQVMSPTGDWGTQGDSTWSAPTDLTPTCVTCHKGHGNNNAFGLVYMTGRVPRTENGNGTRTTDLCKVCHVQGGY